MSLSARVAQAVPGTPAERATEFVPVEGTAETASAELLLIAAYFLMWAAILVFLLLSWRRQQRLETRIERLETALERADGDG